MSANQANNLLDNVETGVKRMKTGAGVRVVAVGLACACALVAVSSGTSAPARIVDRTFVCKPIAYGGVGDLDLEAAPPLRSSFGDRSAHLIVRTGTTLPDEDLVFVRSSVQARLGTTSPFPGPAGVFAHARRCTTTRSQIELSSKGLPGPPTPFATDLACSLRGRVLVRVRARLAGSAVWRPAYEPFLVGVRGRVEDARLAVRAMRGGAPLAYMTVDRAGLTKVWSSSSCS